MLDAICNLVARVVFSGVNGKVLVIPLIILIWTMIGQAKEFNYAYEEAMKEGEKEKDLSSWS